MPNPLVQECIARIRQRCPQVPDLGIVLGSGFAEVSSQVDVAADWSYGDLPGFAKASVPGHAGRLLLGRLAGVAVAVFAGRAHYYEGHGFDLITHPVRVLSELGARSLLLTNAAGGIRSGLKPGDLVVIQDHLNWMGTNPLRGGALPEGFVDLTEVYDAGLRQMLHAAAATLGCVLPEGVYAAVSGPSYETPAEIRALARLGADLVGMSTVPEAIVARQCGLKVAALSCVTNLAAGLGGRISHTEVLAHGRRLGPLAASLLNAFCQQYSRTVLSGQP
ncbi:MAG: purine-nucleoside phosphorylase [Verrucomicrobiales bacterium]|nr:purine-nucleoside phosphorylase [Verrucomicrobiales bacterium]